MGAEAAWLRGAPLSGGLDDPLLDDPLPPPPLTTSAPPPPPLLRPPRPQASPQPAQGVARAGAAQQVVQRRRRPPPRRPLGPHPSQTLREVLDPGADGTEDLQARSCVPWHVQMSGGQAVSA